MGCLTIAPGRGTIADWLAEQVGPGGRVDAPRPDAAFLRALSGASSGGLPFASTATARPGDAPGEEGFDLIHVRAVLKHAPDPALALRHRRRAPAGGVLCVEDLTERPALPTRPTPAAAFDRLSRAGFDAVRAAGTSDSFLGRRLQELVGSAGIAEIGGDGVVLVGKGGDDALGRHQRLLLDLPATQLLVKHGIVTAPDMARFVALYEDPSFAFVGFTLFGAWGRRPAPRAVARTPVRGERSVSRARTLLITGATSGIGRHAAPTSRRAGTA